MIILWGAGTHCDWLLKNYKFPLKLIESVIDIDKSRKGEIFFGNEIQSPEVIYNLKSELVLVGTDKYYKEISEQLEKMNTGKKIQLLDKFLENYSKRDEETTLENYDKENVRLLDKRLKEAGSLTKENLKTAQILSSREEAIEILPKGMNVAEVGVAYGDFSDLILKKMQPSHFYAIDFFNKDNPYISFWGRNDFEESGLTHEEWYRNRFANLISQNKMTVCSGLSWECLEKFNDDFFDFLYIDACHDYDSIKKDIEVAIRKVKHSGYIQFNDYTLFDIYSETCYGVVPAVNEMVRKTNSQIIYYCMNLQRFDDVVVQLNKKDA